MGWIGFWFASPYWSHMLWYIYLVYFVLHDYLWSCGWVAVLYFERILGLEFCAFVYLKFIVSCDEVHMLISYIRYYMLFRFILLHCSSTHQVPITHRISILLFKFGVTIIILGYRSYKPMKKKNPKQDLFAYFCTMKVLVPSFSLLASFLHCVSVY